MEPLHGLLAQFFRTDFRASNSVRQFSKLPAFSLGISSRNHKQWKEQSSVGPPHSFSNHRVPGSGSEEKICVVSECGSMDIESEDNLIHSESCHSHCIMLGFLSSGRSNPLLSKISALTASQCAFYSTHKSSGHLNNSQTVTSTEEEKEKDTTDHLVKMMESPASKSVKTVKVIPGKGPPPEPPVECCMSGCANCVWILYAEELKDYYNDGGKAAREALEQIENPSLKAFLKLELDL